MTEIVQAYRAKLAGRATPNAVNQLHIALDTYLTPADAEALLAAAGAGSLPPASLDWLVRLQRMASRSRLPLQPFVRRPVGDASSLYTHPSLAAAGRTLVVGFAGDAHRLMMPTPVFLQHCRAERMDLLLLQDHARAYFLSGSGGLADDFPGLVAWLGRDAGLAGYARIVSLGVSGGGLPAVCAAVALGFDRAVSVGGVAPTSDHPRLAVQGLTFAPFAAMIAAGGPRRPDVVLVHAEGFETDRGKALEMARVLPARLHPVPGTAKHNVLAEVMQQGGLTALLDELLLDGTALDH